MGNQVTGYLSPLLKDIRIKEASRHLNGDVLDFGCGLGDLSKHVELGKYVGVDIDSEVIEIASKRHPQHSFYSLEKFETDSKKYDTIVSLAVIEHVPSPREFLLNLAGMLNPGGSIIISTPHPAFERIYDFGAAIHLFSHAAHEEHESLLDKASLTLLSEETGLELSLYKRFLFGANQLAIYRAK